MTGLLRLPRFLIRLIAWTLLACNTLPIPAEKRFENLTVLSIAPTIARAIKEVFEDGSVTSLFDGQA